MYEYLKRLRTAAIMDFITGIPDYKGIEQATSGKLWDYVREKGLLPESENQKGWIVM